MSNRWHRPCGYLPGCTNRRYHAAKMCFDCYSKWEGKRESPEILFWAKVNKDGPIPDYSPSLGKCWIWKGATSKKGYGSVHTFPKPTAAHRFSYAIHKGQIPKGLTIDHLCRVPSCVNPDHLEAVTGRINTLRGFSPPAIHVKKTHCPQGHEYSVQNTRVYKGRRNCRMCSKLKTRERRERERNGKSRTASV